MRPTLLRHLGNQKRTTKVQTFIVLRRLSNEATLKRNDFRRRYEYVEH